MLSITGRLVSRETLRKLLHQTGYSYKRRARILLGKADPKQRQDFVLELARLVQQSQQEDGPLLVFSDEAHIHLETDGGSGWSRKGVPLYVNSHSPQRGRKLSCFGFYALGSDRPLLIHTASWATAETTNEALRKLREQHPARRIIVMWDNVRYHHSRQVRAEAAQLGIELRFLPPYSPDLMPVERLWSWLRQQLTYLHWHHCDVGQRPLPPLRTGPRRGCAAGNRAALSASLQSRFDACRAALVVAASAADLSALSPYRAAARRAHRLLRGHGSCQRQ